MISGCITFLPKYRKTLHMFVYLAYLLIVMHVMLGVIQYETHPVCFAAGALWLIGLHLVAGKERLKKTMKNSFRIRKAL